MRSIATDRASDLAQRYGFPDVRRLEPKLHCLADDWVNGRYMDELAASKALENGRKRILRAADRLLAELEAALGIGVGDDNNVAALEQLRPA